MEGLSVRKGGKARIGVVKVELRCNIGALRIRTEFGGILYFNSAVFSQTMRDYRHGSRALNGGRMYKTCSRARLQSSEKQTVSDSHSTCSLVLIECRKCCTGYTAIHSCTSRPHNGWYGPTW